MKIQKMVLLNCRIPGNILICALNTALAQQHEKQWIIQKDEPSTMKLVCRRKGSSKPDIIPGVKISIMEPVSNDRMFNHVTLELAVDGLINNILVARKILSDFERLQAQIVEALKEYHGKPFRMFERCVPQVSAA